MRNEDSGRLIYDSEYLLHASPPSSGHKLIPHLFIDYPDEDGRLTLPDIDVDSESMRAFFEFTYIGTKSCITTENGFRYIRTVYLKLSIICSLPTKTGSLL